MESKFNFSDEDNIGKSSNKLNSKTEFITPRVTSSKGASTVVGASPRWVKR